MMKWYDTAQLVTIKLIIRIRNEHMTVSINKCIKT